MAEDGLTKDFSNGDIHNGVRIDGKKKEEEKNTRDPETLCCLLQPVTADLDPEYISIRRFLLFQKSKSGALNRRYDWKCNGKCYVAYRNFIRRPRKWENLHTFTHLNSPGNSGRWLPSSSPLPNSYEVESFGSSRDLRSGHLVSSHRTSFSSSISDSDRPRAFEPAYSFSGMHCIFDQCKSAVTVLKFGHLSSDLLAYGASDGSLTVCSLSDPPSILNQLIGHSKDVTDFDFSTNNHYLASSSLDKTVRVWELGKGICIRVLYSVSSQLCIRFHPVNNNFVSAGNGNKEITILNFSTGRIVSKLLLDDKLTSMDHDHSGQLIFCGDAQGSLYSLTMDSRTGSISRSHRYRSSNSRSAVTTVQYRSFSLLAAGPVLLTCTQDGYLSFFSIALEVQGYLTLRCSLKLTPRVHRIQASFCPLLSLEKGEYIVAGSEDSNVYFYDLTKPRHTCVNKLQGHRFPVMGVAWNHGENLLASSDMYGIVIVWKRAKTNAT